MNKIIIIGIGQKFRGDDAIGPEVVLAWEEKYPQKAEKLQIKISPLPGLELLGLFEDADTAILVDAVQSGTEAGTIHVASAEQLVSFGAGSGSVHGFGVAETLALGRLANPEAIPENLIIIGIEAKNLDVGESLSAEVRERIPKAVAKLDEIVSRYI
ncbi:MAG: hydrogenase maturation protease [Anaerolineae bacterium]|jgi:hydrogenase maturation protease|nr:hydrogenase maturation protease [Anaerolineae bacterium]MBT7783786.1 hydrogenase maturation protease [Anaerolineae bacterium]